MASIVVNTAEGIGAWSYGDLTVDAEHELKRPSKALSQAVACAIDAGVLVLVSGKPDKSAVEPDKQSLAKQALADKARAPLFADRDAELAEHGAAQEGDPKHKEIVEKHEQRMAEAAQAALEDR